MERHYSSLGAFARNFGPQVSTWIGRARHALIQETTDFMDEHSRREPVGSGRRYKGDKRPGELKASRTVTRSAEQGSISWSAPHALVINLGRKRSKPYSRQLRGTTVPKRGRRGRLLGASGTKPFTRMLGSKQARGGMTRPAFRALRRDWGRVIEKAVARTEAGT
jgi:hypothetical protein